ncbi:hypothetical protein G7046_g8536 [Stylonectria norvegica]|nr:hypothetical protein G7046_g8536 [Stylonectria norvegica]
MVSRHRHHVATDTELEKVTGGALQGPATICISQAEYDDLVNVARQYAVLRQHLLLGGVDEDTIAVSHPETQILPQISPELRLGSLPHSVLLHADCADSIVQETPATQELPQSRNAFANSNGSWTSQHNYSVRSAEQQARIRPARCDGGYAAPSPESPSVKGGSSESILESSQESGHESLQDTKNALRSVQLLNLAEGVTHADITKAVRGGQLVDLYLRRRDRTATVSFVRGQDASAFYDHAQTHGLFVKRKRVGKTDKYLDATLLIDCQVDLRWAERQFNIHGHVAYKIQAGGSRNFVIRRCDPNHTEQSIREDLEHIHNLVVIRIDFVKGDCFISTNSVHNAMFARTCMMSRTKYRGSRFDWVADECAEPLVYMPLSQLQTEPAPRRNPPKPTADRFSSKQPDKSMGNRFELLNLDDDDDDDSAL